MRLTTSVSGGHRLLQMVSEPDIKRCASEDIGPSRGWIVRSHISWSVWKPLLSKHILEPWGWRRHVTGQNGQYLLAVDLGRYAVPLSTRENSFKTVRVTVIRNEQSEQYQLQRAWVATLSLRLLEKTCFKIVRLMLIRNGPKRTIFSSGGLGSLRCPFVY